MQRITFEERLEIERVIKLKFTLAEISKALSRPESTISYEINRLGKWQDYNAIDAHESSRSKALPTRFNGVKRISLTERQKIQQFLADGISVRDMAIALKRTASCIRREIKRSGDIPYYAEKVHEEAEYKFTKLRVENSRKAKLNRSLENSDVFIEVVNRLGDLEMQIEILVQTIKELKDGKD